MRRIYFLLAFWLLLSGCVFAQTPNLDTNIKGSRLPSSAIDSGSVNAYVLTTFGPLGPSVRTLSCFKFIALNANTGASTAVVDGGSTITITRTDGSTALSANDINGLTEICYDGTNFRCLTCGLSGSSSGRALSFTIYNSGGLAAATTIDSTDYLTVPFACTVSAYNLLIDTGTITVKFWKVATGTAIPTSGNSISTSGVSISSGTAIHSTTVTDFTTTAVSANDILAMNITAVASATYVNGVLECD